MGEQQHTLSFLGNENYKVIFTEGNSVLPYLYSCEIPTKYSFPTVAKNDLWNRVCWSLSPSVCPFVCQSRCFLGIEGVFLEFSKVWHGSRNSFEVVHHRAKFFGKTLCSQDGQKRVFFEIIGKFGLSFFLNLSYNLFCSETLSYYLCSCTNPILGKNLVPEIWTKMISANHIAGFLNQLYLQKKLMKWSDFLHADTNLQKLKTNWIFFVQKLVWSLWSQDSKIAVSQEWIDGINWFYAYWYNFRKVKSYSSDFWVSEFKNWWDLLFHWTLKSAVSQ